MLIFVFYTIWMYIDELAGRGLELWIIGKFVFFYIPQLTPIILPLTVVLSSIMTFGSLAENYEFAAIKASGISLQRAMRVLVIFMVFLCIATFFLANNVIPLAHEKIVDMRINIAKIKPAMAIKEGVFSNIGEEISIKVAKKSGDNDQYLNQVIIHKKSPDRVNRVVINAEKGELINDKDSDIIQLVLYRGNYYEDVKVDNYKQREKYPFAKVSFDRYVMNIDLSKLNDVDINEKNNITTYRMMNVSQLTRSIDSITQDYKENLTAYGESLYRRTGISYIDETTDRPEILSKDLDTIKRVRKDSIQKIEQVIDLFKDWKKTQLLDLAIDNNRGQLTNYEYKKEDVERRNKNLNKFYITLNDKFALSVACFVLFFVGTPLGAIIRKGGIGMPLVVAMGLFLSYHFIGLFTKNFAEDGAINPILAPWIPTLLLLPFGIILTAQVTSDRSFMESVNLFNPLMIFSRLKKKS